jgi:hypothetical protein
LPQPGGHSVKNWANAAISVIDGFGGRLCLSNALVASLLFAKNAGNLTTFGVGCANRIVFPYFRLMGGGGTIV